MKQRKVEKEKETLVGQWKRCHPARIACGNHCTCSPERWKEVQKRAPPPPHCHTPFDQFEAAVVDL